MSSKYTAEQLSWQIIKALLWLLKSGGKILVEEGYRFVEKQVPAKLKSQFKLKGKAEFKRILYYSYRRGYVRKVSGSGDGAEIAITKIGEQKLTELEFQALSLTKNQKWDGKWWVLAFDIPENKRAARYQIRKLIKQLGFRQLQRSVWVHPLPCAEAIQIIKDSYGIHADLVLLKVDSFDRVEQFRYLFRKEIAL